MRNALFRLSLMALFAFSLAGCGGGENGWNLSSLTGTPSVGEPGPQGPAGADGADGADGTDGVDGVDGAGYDLSRATITVVSATVVNGRPQVVFDMKDANGVAFNKLGQTVNGSTIGLTLRLAKLAPRSRYTSGHDWFSYHLQAGGNGLIRGTGGESIAAGTLELLENGRYRYTFALDLSSGSVEASSTNAWMKNNTGRIAGGANDTCGGNADLVWLKDGTAFPCGVDVLVDQGAGNNTQILRVHYNPTLTHRISFQPSGFPQSPESQPAFDFVPAGGAVTVTRDIVDVASCNNCHDDLLRTNHGGNRRNTQLCVSCHNPGHFRDTGRSLDLKQLVHSAHRGIGSPLRKANFTDGYGTRAIDGVVQPRFANLKFPVGIHGNGVGAGMEYGIGTCVKCHMGQDSYNGLITLATGSGENAATAKARVDALKLAKVTPNGDMWRQRSVEACSSCHDDVRWWDGAASVEAGLQAIAGADTTAWNTFRRQHPGGVSSSGTDVGGGLISCSNGSCHGSSTAPVDGTQLGDNNAGAIVKPIHRAHLVLTRAEIRSSMMKGEFKDLAYDAGTNRLNFKFRVLDQAKGAALVDGVGGETIGMQFHIGFMRDGYADYTTQTSGSSGQPMNVTFANARVDSDPVTAGVQPTIDADGYYSLSTSVAALALPATDFTLAISYQNGAQGATWTTEPVGGNAANQVQPRAEVAFVSVGNPTVKARRYPVNFVDTCRNCHVRLNKHGGGRNDPKVCTMCHNPQLTDVNNNLRQGRVGKLDGKLEESEDFKRLIHAVHGSGKRTYGYQTRNGGFGAGNAQLFGGPLTVLWADGTETAGVNNTYYINGEGVRVLRANGELAAVGDIRQGFSRFPSRGGSPSNCNKCHVSNSYSLPIGQWGAATTKGQVIGSSVRTHDWNDRNTTNLNAAGYINDNGINVVTNHLKMSPTVAVCSSCHDTVAAAGHMRTNGGTLPLAYAARKTFADGAAVTDAANLANPDPSLEACVVCHGPGRIKDLAVVHSLN